MHMIPTLEEIRAALDSAEWSTDVCLNRVAKGENWRAFEFRCGAPSACVMLERKWSPNHNTSEIKHWHSTVEEAYAECVRVATLAGWGATPAPVESLGIAGEG